MSENIFDICKENEIPLAVNWISKIRPKVDKWIIDFTVDRFYDYFNKKTRTLFDISI